jgi:hypothetical protein
VSAHEPQHFLGGAIGYRRFAAICAVAVAVWIVLFVLVAVLV